MIHDENNVLTDDELVVVRDPLSCCIIYEVIILSELINSLNVVVFRSFQQIYLFKYCVLLS